MGIFKAGTMISAYKQLHEGMSKQAVIALLGQPNGQKRRGSVETLIWRNREFKGLARGGTMERTLEVDFENDKVIGWDGQNITASRW